MADQSVIKQRFLGDHSNHLKLSFVAVAQYILSEIHSFAEAQRSPEVPKEREAKTLQPLGCGYLPYRFLVPKPSSPAVDSNDLLHVRQSGSTLGVRQLSGHQLSPAAASSEFRVFLETSPPKSAFSIAFTSRSFAT